MAKRFLRKRQVAERYGVHERSIDRMAEDGRLPPPHFHGGRIPRWNEDELDAWDRAATRERATTPVKRGADGSTTEAAG
jgi:excisionase family DNA binding protein